MSQTITLTLDDGTFIEGESFGAFTTASGEVVSSTAMTGYPDNLSKGELDNDSKIRRTAMDFGVPLLTNARRARRLFKRFVRRK